jgi:trehalose 6-phosphate phosphatase
MQHLRRTAVVGAKRLVADPSEWALFLDIDGTLLDMAPTPDAVVVPPGTVELLSSLAQRFEGAVALSTGRRVGDADRLFAPLKLTTSGVHGTEVRTGSGAKTTMLTPPAPLELVQAVNRAAGMAPGALVELKGAGIAVHYRNVPDACALLELELARIIGGRYDMELRAGRKVFEIIPKGYSKGSALRWLMELSPFRGRRPVMIGDDKGDEPALLAAQSLGGFGLKVAGEHFARACADFDGVAPVRSWLWALAADGGAHARPLEMAPTARPQQ